MEGKIWGVPVIIIVLALAIAALVDVPLVLLNVTTQSKLTLLQASQENTDTTVNKLIPVVTPTPIATPSATPVLQPKAVKQSIVTPVPTTGRVR